MSKVNQQTIADIACVSRATVSRCFTNHPGINPETRAEVFRVAAELGYRHLEPRNGFESRRAAKNTIGVLVCTHPHHFVRTDFKSPGIEIHSGISEYAQIHKLPIDMRYANPAEGSIEGESYAAIQPIRRREWGGCLLIYPFPQKVIDALRTTFPLVSLVEQYAESPVDCVDVDHFTGISAIIDYLVSLGHRRIGFYTQEYEIEASWSLRRHSAFMEKMIRMRIRVPQEDVVNVFPGVSESGDQSFDLVARRVADGVTAWVCAADHQAYELIAALEARGIRVPRDVSVTGFDGVQPLGDLRQLTTVVIPYREIGYTGAKRLHDLMRRRFVSTQHILVGTSVRVGDTTAAPRA
jgi:DNA-binding LacI/PurR family transcriptional regulator